tara:strand:- start:398 stop:1546 length:1149 start_codon:yes stop_codon:yes gene_type:complete
MINALSTRSDYPCLGQSVYLNQASLGLLSDKTVAEMTEFLNTVARYGNLKMSDKEEANFLNPLRGNISKLLQTEHDNIAILSSASELLSQVPKLCSPAPNSKIILVSTDFPSITRPWLINNKTGKFEICFVSEVPQTDLTQTIIENIDSNTSVVCVSYVQFASGTRINVKKLIKYTKEVGAKFVIDVTQAAGAMPINMSEWSADILVCSGYKWLGGHGGVAFGWLSNEMLRKDPPTVGWFGNENPFDMEATKLNLSKTAAKYTQSTISYISAVGLQTAIQQLLNINVLNIMKHSDKLAKMLFSILEDSDWKSFRPTTSSEFSSHIISLMHPSADRIKSSFEELSKKGVICGIRNGRLRISISHYNDSNDVKHLGDSLLNNFS